MGSDIRKLQLSRGTGAPGHSGTADTNLCRRAPETPCRSLNPSNPEYPLIKQTILAAAAMSVLGIGEIHAQERIVPANQQRAYDQFHYAPAVKVGNTYYFSGVIAGDEDPEAQFAQVFERIKAMLEEQGGSISNIVEMTTFHVNMSEHIQTFMTVKDRYMTENYPAWTAIGIEQLFSPRALVEVKVTAVIE